MSKINPLYEQGDILYFRNLHKERMHQLGCEPLKYSAFYSRLRRGASLRDAIYTPSNIRMARYNMKPKKNSIWIRFISFFKGLFDKCE